MTALNKAAAVAVIGAGVNYPKGPLAWAGERFHGKRQ